MASRRLATCLGDVRGGLSQTFSPYSDENPSPTSCNRSIRPIQKISSKAIITDPSQPHEDINHGSTTDDDISSSSTASTTASPRPISDQQIAGSEQFLDDNDQSRRWQQRRHQSMGTSTSLKSMASRAMPKLKSMDHQNPMNGQMCLIKICRIDSLLLHQSLAATSSNFQ
ncbi:hypothetical protein ACLOJK_036834 [Asimina triloba]